MPENLNKEPEDIFEGIDEPKHSIKKENSEESEEKPKEKTIPQKENKNLAKLKKSLSVFFSFKISKEDWKYLGILFLIGLILDGIIILYSIQKLDFQSDIKVNFSHEKISEQISSPEQENINTDIIDTDGDGLSDEEENRLGTYILEPDSDNDGLFDREEVKVYRTDPLNPDTDGDGLSDGEEVRRGLDPNDSDPDAQLLNIKSEINK